MYPFADQILGYQVHDEEKPIGSFILEVKGDLCDKVREILARHNRTQDLEYFSEASVTRVPRLTNKPIPTDLRSLWRRIAVQWAR